MDIAVKILEAVLGLFFILVAFPKLGRKQQMADSFARYGLPSWFLMLTGIVEVVAGAALLAGIWIPLWGMLASIALGVTMAAGAYFHVKVRDPIARVATPVVLLVLLVIVVLGH